MARVGRGARPYANEGLSRHRNDSFDCRLSCDLKHPPEGVVLPSSRCNVGANLYASDNPLLYKRLH